MSDIVDVKKGKFDNSKNSDVPKCFCGYEPVDKADLFIHMTKLHSVSDMLKFISGA